MPRTICLVLLAALCAGCPQKQDPAPTPQLNPGAATALGAGQRANIRTTLKNLEKACVQFNAKEGTWPADVQALIDAGIWQDAERADPWGNDYVIESSGSSVTAWTYGADGEPGGEDADQDYSSAEGR